MRSSILCAYTLLAASTVYAGIVEAFDHSILNARAGLPVTVPNNQSMKATGILPRNNPLPAIDRYNKMVKTRRDIASRARVNSPVEERARDSDDQANDCDTDTEEDDDGDDADDCDENEEDSQSSATVSGASSASNSTSAPSKLATPSNM